MRAILLLAAVSGCYWTEATICGELRCPRGKVCSPGGNACVLPDQIDACAGTIEGGSCSALEIGQGVCVGSVCVAAGCGNGFLEAGELCDDGNLLSLDGCRADCRSTERCGDGVAESLLGEQCDCGATVTQACANPNSDAPGAECRTDCRIGGCGDGILDPAEICDDDNIVYGDGCRGDCQGRFAKMQSPATRFLRWVHGFGGNAFAGAQDFMEAPIFIAFDGITWSSIALPPPGGGMTAAWAASEGEVYFVRTAETSEVWRYDGAEWHFVTSLPGYMKSIWGAGATSIYVVGSHGSLQPKIHHFDGSRWRELATCAELYNPQDVYASAPDNVFIGSDSGICRFDGTSWTFTPQNLVVDLDGHGSDVFALTPGQLMRWTGSGWTATPTPRSCNGIAALGNGRVLAVSSAGTILEHDGTSWTNLASPTERTLIAIDATHETNVFVVGDAGTILH